MHPEDGPDWQKSELLTVSRGSCTSEGERIMKVWNQVVNGKIKDYEVPALIKKIKDSKWNYGGTFYSVYFRVNRPIMLHELGFFGPFSEAKTTYYAHVEIYEPKEKQTMPNSWESLCVGQRKGDVLAKKDEIFYVELDHGVQIVPNIWYLVQFKLEGPNTLRCESVGTIVKVEDEGQEIIFEFNKGSFQLPSMKFSVLSEYGLPKGKHSFFSANEKA